MSEPPISHATSHRKNLESVHPQFIFTSPEIASTKKRKLPDRLQFFMDSLVSVGCQQTISRPAWASNRAGENEDNFLKLSALNEPPCLIR
jgi:hypothetical protein